MDITNLTAAELKAELKRREEASKDNRKAYRNLVDEEIPEMVNELIFLSERMSIVKTKVFQGLETLIKSRNEAYGVNPKQKSYTFTTNDSKSITLGYRVVDGWDETVNVGVAKVRDFIASLAKDDNSAKLVDVVNSLLKKDHKGNLKSNRVLELQKMTDRFDDEGFADGVSIISKAYQPVNSCYFIESYYKDESGRKVNIPLSISAVDFTAEADINFQNI